MKLNDIVVYIVGVFYRLVETRVENGLTSKHLLTVDVFEAEFILNGKRV
jgi:hypothetical protein